jgi:hypothetical protein
MLKGPIGRRRNWRCMESFDRDLTADALVRALMVVDHGEGVELGLKFVEVLGEGLFAQPLVEGLLETFDFAGGLGVERSTGDRSDTGITELTFEEHLELAEPAGERETIVGQHSRRQPESLSCLHKGCPRLDAGGLSDAAAGDHDPGVIIDDVEHLGHAGGDRPVHRIDLPPLVRCRRLEPTERSLRPFVRLGVDLTASHQNPMNRRHRRHHHDRGVAAKMPLDRGRP